MDNSYVKESLIAVHSLTKDPANTKLLVVVDKLLTGFNAPPCTYLYIDRSMQNHGLFQAMGVTVERFYVRR